jgi:formyl-CoA transferase
MKIVGRPDLGDDPRYEDRRDRVAIADELDAAITAWTEKRPKHEVLAIVAGAGVPCGAVLDSAEVLSDPHLRQRGFITDLTHPTRGVYPMPGNPVLLSDSPTEMVRSPLLGEHNREIYGKLLGVAPEEIDTLRRDGVI